MCLYLVAIFTGQGHISEVKICSQSSKGRADILTEVIPLQTQFLFGQLHLVKIYGFREQFEKVLLKEDLGGMAGGEYSTKSAPSNASQRTRKIQSARTSAQQVENIKTPLPPAPLMHLSNLSTFGFSM